MWNKFWALSRRERRLLVQALIRLPVAAIRVRLDSATLLRLQPTSAAGLAGDEPAVIREAARMVNAAARYAPMSATCLPKSIVLQQLLRREGIETTLRIGVRKAGASLDGHAWLEYRGVPVADPPSVHDCFTVLHADGRS
jgi:hypothetical protein